MDTKTMSVQEAIETVIKMLEQVEVKGHANTSKLSQSQELLAKVLKFMEEESKKEPEIEVEEIHPVDTVPKE